MSDVATQWSSSYGDWVVAGADLQSDSTLISAILISAFTDRVLPDGTAPPDGSTDPRGWWGDDPLYPIGSRIWTLLRAEQSDATLKDARDYLVECLQWLIDDGVVASFDITTEWDGQGFLAAQVVAYEPTGATSTANFSWAWQGIN